MELEEKIRQHKEISLKIEALEKQKKTLSEVIIQSMTSKTLKIGHYFVRRISRLSISKTPDQARLHHAVKLEEVVDKEKIKALYNNRHL
jgi:hypothetical protein